MSGQSGWLRLHERTALSRREASLTPARERRSRDHFDIDSVRPKHPPLYVPVSMSPVSREASRNLWHSIGPSTMVLFKQQTLLSAHPQSAKENRRFNIHVQGKTNFILRDFKQDETAEINLSNQRGRRKTTELCTSGAKRAETWRGGVKWWKLAIGLAVASGGKTETGKED